MWLRGVNGIDGRRQTPSPACCVPGMGSYDVDRVVHDVDERGNAASRGARGVCFCCGDVSLCAAMGRNRSVLVAPSAFGAGLRAPVVAAAIGRGLERAGVIPPPDL